MRVFHARDVSSNLTGGILRRETIMPSGMRTLCRTCKRRFPTTRGLKQHIARSDCDGNPLPQSTQRLIEVCHSIYDRLSIHSDGRSRWVCDQLRSLLDRKPGRERKRECYE